MHSELKTVNLIGILIVLCIIAGLLLALSNTAREQRLFSISSYDDCVRAGYPVMDSYPSQCRTPDGRTFTNPNEQVTMPNASSTQPITANGCQVGGCSGQLCGEAGEDLVSNCEYRPEYACYQKYSMCERQANGKCGWTPNASLSQCLSNPASSKTPPAPPAQSN